MNLLPQLDWVALASDLLDLMIAYVLTLPIGWERERDARSAGLRTFPLSAGNSMKSEFC